MRGCPPRWGGRNCSLRAPPRTVGQQCGGRKGSTRTAPHNTADPPCHRYSWSQQPIMARLARAKRNRVSSASRRATLQASRHNQYASNLRDILLAYHACQYFLFATVDLAVGVASAPDCDYHLLESAALPVATSMLWYTCTAWLYKGQVPPLIRWSRYSRTARPPSRHASSPCTWPSKALPLANQLVARLAWWVLFVSLALDAH